MVWLKSLVYLLSGPLATSKGEKVVEVWEALSEEGGWNPRFTRHFNDWELNMVQEFISTI